MSSQATQTLRLLAIPREIRNTILDHLIEHMTIDTCANEVLESDHMGCQLIPRNPWIGALLANHQLRVELLARMQIVPARIVTLHTKSFDCARQCVNRYPNLRRVTESVTFELRPKIKFIRSTADGAQKLRFWEEMLYSRAIGILEGRDIGRMSVRVWEARELVPEVGADDLNENLIITGQLTVPEYYPWSHSSYLSSLRV
jgi:hypothetical protein